MKIVQTLWTLPSLEDNKGITQFKLKGGWLESKYYYYSIAYSCLSLTKFYDSVEIFTDKVGYDLLINKFSLPYTSIKFLPQEFDNVPVGLWALPKIYAYSMQNEPFIHVDNDVYIWSKFDHDLEQAPLVVQNCEKLTFDYDIALDAILNNFNFIPSFLKKEFNKFAYQSINAGIFGGNDLKFK